MYEFLLIAGVFLWITVATFYIRSGVASVFHPATYYLFFHGFIFVLRPILAYANDYSFVYTLYGFQPLLSVKATALLVADLGFVAFMVAVLLAGRKPLVLAPTAGSIDDDQRRYRMPLLVTAAILAPLGIYSLRYVLQSDADGVVGMTYDMATGYTISTTGNGYLFTAGDLVGALTVLIAWQFRFRLAALVPFLAYVVTRASVGGMRWAFLLTSVSLALFWLYDQRRRWPSIPILVGGVALLGAFTVIGQQRDIVKSYFTGGEVKHEFFQERVLEGMDYANLEYLEYVAWTIPEKTGTWGYFADNLQVLTEPIPRVLWRDKPIGPPIVMWDLWRYGNPIGMSISLPGEGWAQLGYPGVIIWCALIGWLFGRFYNWFVQSRQTPFRVATYILVLSLTVQFFRDGGLLTMLKFPMWAIVTILVWLAISKLLPGMSATKQVTVLAR